MKKVDEVSLANIKQYDHVALLDAIEQVDYIEKLFAPGPNGEASAIKSQLLSLYQNIETLKQADDGCESEVWNQAIEADDTLWAAGTACHEVIVALFKLLQCNPKLATQYVEDFGEDDDTDEDDT